MKKLLCYFGDSYTEIKTKVTWPKSDSLQKNTMIVISSTIIVSLLIWAMDSFSSIVLKAVYTIF